MRARRCINNQFKGQGSRFKVKSLLNPPTNQPSTLKLSNLELSTFNFEPLQPATTAPLNILYIDASIKIPPRIATIDEPAGKS